MKTELINVTDEWINFCGKKGIKYQDDLNINSYDDTTLFCPAGMQQFKNLYKDLNHKGTISNIQPCLRLNDLNEIGDGTHLLYFNMIGFFSFREWTVKQTIDLWMEFLKHIDVFPDYITIHPDKNDWKYFYRDYDIEIRYDKDCKWTDGEIGGYCTEFYKNDIEIGNIVNTNGDSIDVGFGLERIESIITGRIKTKEDILKETIFKIIEAGVKPSYTKQGYILRKLLRISHKEGIEIDHIFFKEETKRQEKNISKWNKLKDKHKDKSKEWWWETMGIDLDII